MIKSKPPLDRVLGSINARYVKVWYAFLIFMALWCLYEVFSALSSGEVHEFTGRGDAIYSVDADPLSFYANIGGLVFLIMSSVICFIMTRHEMARRRRACLINSDAADDDVKPAA
jgi:membrane associated rhomboid family serine protease